MMQDITNTELGHTSTTKHPFNQSTQPQTKPMKLHLPDRRHTTQLHSIKLERSGLHTTPYQQDNHTTHQPISTNQKYNTSHTTIPTRYHHHSHLHRMDMEYITHHPNPIITRAMDGEFSHRHHHITPPKSTTPTTTCYHSTIPKKHSTHTKRHLNAHKHTYRNSTKIMKHKPKSIFNIRSVQLTNYHFHGCFLKTIQPTSTSTQTQCRHCHHNNSYTK